MPSSGARCEPWACYSPCRHRSSTFGGCFGLLQPTFRILGSVRGAQRIRTPAVEQMHVGAVDRHSHCIPLGDRGAVRDKRSNALGPKAHVYEPLVSELLNELDAPTVSVPRRRRLHFDVARPDSQRRTGAEALVGHVVEAPTEIDLDAAVLEHRSAALRP